MAVASGSWPCHDATPARHPSRARDSPNQRSPRLVGCPQPARLLQLLDQGVPVIRIARKTARSLAGGDRNADLDAEFVRLTRLALADAFHFRGMRRTANTDFPSIVRRPLHRTGRMHARDKANLPSNAPAMPADRHRPGWPASAMKVLAPTPSTASVGSAAPADDADRSGSPVANETTRRRRRAQQQNDVYAWAQIARKQASA